MTKKRLMKNLMKRSGKTYKLFNHSINKFHLMLRKGVCPYGYMDDWEKFNEVSVSEK